MSSCSVVTEQRHLLLTGPRPEEGVSKAVRAHYSLSRKPEVHETKQGNLILQCLLLVSVHISNWLACFLLLICTWQSAPGYASLTGRFILCPPGYWRAGASCRDFPIRRCDTYHDSSSDAHINPRRACAARVTVLGGTTAVPRPTRACSFSCVTLQLRNP